VVHLLIKEILYKVIKDYLFIDLFNNIVIFVKINDYIYLLDKI